MDRSSRWLYLAPILILLAGIVGYLRDKHYPLASAEALILVSAAGAAGLGFGLLCAKIPQKLGACILALLAFAAASLVFNTSGQLLNFLVAQGLEPILRWPIAALILLGIPVVVVLLVRQELPRVLCAMAGVFLAAILLTPAAPSVATWRHQPAQVGAPPGRLVLHVILDGFMGEAGLEKGFEGAEELRREISSFFLAHGFALHAGAFSSYKLTGQSVPALLNFARPPPEEAAALSRGKPYPWLGLLHDKKYRVEYIGTSFFPACDGPNRAFVSGCTLFPMYSLEYIRADASLSAWQKASDILQGAFMGNDLVQHACKIVGRDCNVAVPFSWIAGDQFRQLDDMLQSTGGELAIVAHVLLPHPPYFFDENCRRNSTRARLALQDRRSEERAFGAHVGCVLNQLGRTLAIIDRRWSNATIILHGDHGLRPDWSDDIRMNYAALFAVRGPGIIPGITFKQENLQMLFARYAGGKSLPNSGTVFGEAGDIAEYPPR